MIDKFRGQYFFLSNFYTPAVIVHEGVKYPSSEHLFMALKSGSQMIREMIALQPKPSDAKKAGRLIELQPGWDDKLRIPAMQFVLRTKFSDPHFTKKLLNTENRKLIEGNMHHDNFWGDCRCSKCKNIKGKNNLGKVLMDIRADLPFGIKNLHKPEFILPEFYLKG